MIAIIIIVCYTLLCAGVCVFIGNRRYSKEGQSMPSSKFLVFTGIAWLAMLTLALWWHFSGNGVYTELLLKWITLFFGCYLCACIDYKEMLIPNKIIVLLLCVRIVFLLYEIYQNHEYLKMVLGYPLLGAFIGGFVFILAKLIAKGGVGMGDIKLFIAIGFYVGSAEIMPVLFYSCLCMAGFSLILLMLKKVTLKDSLPMAPFAFLGVFLRICVHVLGS